MDIRNSTQTIYAVATGAGRAAIAVIRVSGPGARGAIEALAGKAPAPRQAHLTRFRDQNTGEALDQGLLLWFPAPHSATGEDYAELHLHGGRAVIEAVSTALSRIPGVREAEPGEFARRAFANGKMDLSQVEGLADLIDAQTEFQRRQALRALGGALRLRVEAWRETLIRCLALVEAELDFSDEEDVGVSPHGELDSVLLALVSEVRESTKRAPASERLHDGFVVLIMGPPNSGKSTLLNALAQRDLAIVSPIPGTTRDMIEAHLDIGGMPVTFVDSAGVRETSDEIEQLGVARTLDRARHADLILWLSEGGEISAPDGLGVEQSGAETLSVATKADVVLDKSGGLAISAKTGLGLEQLLRHILDSAKARLGDGTSSILIRERHRALLETAAGNLELARQPGKPLEFVADDLRAAGRALGAIVGVVDVEDVLDAIFAQFCIGK